jgi:ElaB/YqjD/DUF883 family membrane-anchored ribosome-binding protein
MAQGSGSDMAGKVGEASDKVAGNVQDKVEQGKAMWQDAKATAGEAMNRASAAARDVSAAGAQAGETLQGVARQVGTQASQAATTLYEQGTNAGGYVSRYAAEQPWTALLLAAAVGYGLAYLIHRP